MGGSFRIALLIFLLFAVSAIDTFAGEKGQQFSPWVDGKGTIALPDQFFSSWSHLGTWFLTSSPAAGHAPGPAHPGKGIHNVYTQPGTLEAFQKEGQWPDGATIVMEVRSMKWVDLPTGHVIKEGNPVQWFVMIRDRQQRYPGNPHWGNGWGWALFAPSNVNTNASADYRKDCLGCHETAKASDLVFVKGYPVLRQHTR